MDSFNPLCGLDFGSLSLNLPNDFFLQKISSQSDDKLEI